VLSHLLSLYGARTPLLLALVDDAPDLAQPIQANYPDIRAQVVFAVQSEMAHTLVDILRRRTTLAMHYHYGLSALPVVTQVLRQYCGWDEAQCDRQIQAYHRFMEANCIPDYELGQATPALQTA
jgi:glycerol-3-phosphate dehydrogenase